LHRNASHRGRKEGNRYASTFLSSFSFFIPVDFLHSPALPTTLANELIDSASKIKSSPSTAAPSKASKQLQASNTAVALYAYIKKEEQELSFGADDVITIVQLVDDVWFYGELNGKQGYVPKSYCKFS
jgi:cortactin